MTVLNRLRRMTPDEMSWRARAAARIAADRVAVRLRPREWRREDIGVVLAPDVIDVQADAMISAERWDALHDHFVRRLLQRPARFVLDPASAEALRAAVVQHDPEASARAAEQADAILSGHYDLLGYRSLNCTGAGGRVDWHLDPVHQARAPLRFWASRIDFMEKSLTRARPAGQEVQ